MPSFGLPSARAEASRRNGAKSCGPKTQEGKARSAQNALRHGFRAQKFLLLADEDAAGFAAFEAALLEELAPAGTLQSVLEQRLVVAAWRLNRADRMERDLLDEESGPQRRPRPGPDPRRPRRPRRPDPAALPRRGDGRVPAPAAHARGASGQGPGTHRLGRGARAPAAAEAESGRTRAPRKCWRFHPSGRSRRATAALRSGPARRLPLSAGPVGASPVDVMPAGRARFGSRPAPARPRPRPRRSPRRRARTRAGPHGRAAAPRSGPADRPPGASGSCAPG
jgi:hypothetical protein